MGRINLPIPNKAEACADGGGIDEAVKPPPKKSKGPTIHKGRTLALTSGSTTPVGDLEGGDKGAPAVDALLGATSLPP
ncbi:hypothetical protein A2U01_0085421, partial [Trifolium medium]|nr:hypothetical protein [Trifolium medium]